MSAREITFKTDNRRKKRAYYFSRRQFRWFPMPVKSAEHLISSGEAFFVPLHKTVMPPGGKAVSEGRHPESEGGTMAGAPLCRRRNSPTSGPWDRAIAMLDKARTLKQLNAAYGKARAYLLEHTAGNEYEQIWCEYNARIGNVTG